MKMRQCSSMNQNNKLNSSSWLFPLAAILLSTLILSVKNVNGQTPTSQPTPQCNTIFISILSWNFSNDTDVDPSSFEGTFELSSELAYGAPQWIEESLEDTKLYLLVNNWVIQNDDSPPNYLSYEDSDSSFPPIGDEIWIHGSLVDFAYVRLQCSETYVPSTEPTDMPSGIPSGTPSSMPSGIPSATPSSMPSGIPSTVPTGQPTGAPTVLCDIIHLTLNESTLTEVTNRRRAMEEEEQAQGDQPLAPPRRLAEEPEQPLAPPRRLEEDPDQPLAPPRRLTGDDLLYLDEMIDGMFFYKTDRIEDDHNVYTYNNTEDDVIADIVAGDSGWTISLFINWTTNQFNYDWNEFSGEDASLPPARTTWTADWEPEYTAIINLDCLGTLYPTNNPSVVPSLMPSNNPTLMPSDMPTAPSLSPTNAPTEECDELVLEVVDANYDVSNYTVNGVIVLDIEGTYVKQSNLKSSRPWFEFSDNGDVWIEFNDDGWYLVNPTETEDDSLKTLFFESSAYEPPIDLSGAGSVNGSWWISEERTDDGSEFKSYMISLTCRVYTNPPTSGPTTMTPIMMSSTAMPETTEPEPTPTDGAVEDESDPEYFGFTLIEWFVIIFLIFLILICCIGICWYREYKKAEIIEKEKQTKLTAYKDDDENEIFGANRRSQAPNSPRQNRPADGNKSGARYVSEVADDDYGKANNGAMDQDAAFQNALLAATKSKTSV